MKRAPFVIPREIMIRGKRWLVAYDTDLGDDKHDVRSRLELRKGGHLRAACYPPAHPHIEREIHMSTYSNRDPREACSTFLHELLHACSTTGVIPHKQEEAFVADVETPLLRALEQLEWKK